MERTTESINNVRVDKAIYIENELTFTINQNEDGVLNCIVNGNNFSVSNYYQPNVSTNINFFNTNFDIQIVNDVLNEIDEIVAEYNTSTETE